MPQMNSFTIGLRATMNVGNYENINPQAQATFTPLDGETIEEAAAKATQQVHTLFAEAARDLIQTADVSDYRRRELLLRVGVVWDADPDDDFDDDDDKSPDDEDFGDDDEE